MSSKMIVSWPERFALIDHFKPTDEAICRVFELSPEELEFSRGLKEAGLITTSSSFDVTKYSDVFAVGSAAISTSRNTAVSKPTRASSNTTSFARPESASRPPKAPPLKRGRKGNKIALALQAVPLSHVPIDDFIEKHGVSIAVLRQSKRFIAELEPEVAAKIGRVCVRQDKATKQLMIWREEA